MRVVWPLGAVACILLAAVLASAVLLLAWRGFLPQSQIWIEPPMEDQRV
jgi:hypothetical protein